MAREGEALWACSRAEGRRLPFTAHPGAFNAEYFEALLEADRRKKAPAPRGKWKDRQEDVLPRLYLLPSDNTLTSDAGLRAIVRRFAADEGAFFAAFARGYRKL